MMGRPKQFGCIVEAGLQTRFYAHLRKDFVKIATSRILA
jgi:hypothetical protein